MLRDAQHMSAGTREEEPAATSFCGGAADAVESALYAPGCDQSSERRPGARRILGAHLQRPRDAYSKSRRKWGPVRSHAKRISAVTRWILAA